MGDRDHNRHGPKRGGLLCPFRGGAGSLSNTMSAGTRSTSVQSGVFIHPAVWPQETWAKNWVGAMPFFLGEVGPHRTQSPRPRSACIPSGMLIRPAVCPQRTWAENWGLCPF